jgi:flagellar motor switch/type III secretory pathway protein FliN
VGSVAPVTSVRQGAAPAALSVAPMKELNPGDVLPWLPCTLALEVSVVGFTVGSLLKLAQGALVQTSCHQSSDIPLQVNGILMAWTEFEVVGDRLAARITDLV